MADLYTENLSDLRKAQTGLQVASRDFREKSILAGASPLTNTWYARARWGFFTHYTFGGVANPQTIYANGTTAANLDQLANAFDVTKFVQAQIDIGAEYVVFTAWHFAMYVMYPSTVMNSYLTGHASSRDVISEIAVACKAAGIRFVLYVHPLDGMDLQAGEQTATGWGDSTGHYAAWNTFINALFVEMGNRYGELVDGYWIDAVVDTTAWTTRFNVAQTATLKASMLAGNPARILIANRFTDTIGDQTQTFIGDYNAKEYNDPGNSIPPAAIGDWLAAYNSMTALGTTNNSWWAKTPTGTNVARFSGSDFFRYLVLQAGANINQGGGGFLLNAGVYAGSPPSVFEDGVETMLKGIGTLVKKFSEGLRDVIECSAYVTANTKTLNNLGTPGFVATRAHDLLYDYIHVLNPPAGNFALPAPADGSLYLDGINLETGRPVLIGKIGDGTYSIALNSSDSWSSVLTTIRLRRKSGVGHKVCLYAKDLTLIGGATEQAQGGGSRFPTIRFLQSTTGQQAQGTVMIPSDWKTFDVDLLLAPSAGNGAGTASMIVTTSDVLPGELLTANDQQLISGTVTYESGSVVVNKLASVKVGRSVRNRPGAARHIRILRGNDGGAQLDLVQVVFTRVL